MVLWSFFISIKPKVKQKMKDERGKAKKDKRRGKIGVKRWEETALNDDHDDGENTVN